MVQTRSGRRTQTAKEESRTKSPVSQRKTRSSKPEANAKSPTESQSKDKESDKEKRVVQAESHPSTVRPATPPLKCSENVVIQLSQAEPEKKNLTELETYAICSENDEKQIVQTESQPSPVQSEALSDQLELADSKCSDVENNANIEKEKLTEAQNASYCDNKGGDLERKTQSETLTVINVVLISDENKDTASDGSSDVVLVESSESVIPGTSTTPPVTAASPAENDPNVFVIGTQPGLDHDRKFYLDSSEESGAESGDGDEESDKEEEADFIDEDENENDEDDILKTKSKLINSSSSIDTGLNLKELGGLYKQGANSKAVKKIKDQNKDELLKNIILTPEFEKRYRVPALKVSERQMKKKRKEEESRTRSPVSQRKTRSSKPEANAKSPTESQSKDKESDKEKRVVQAESHPSTVQRATPPLKCSENVVIQLSQAEPEKKNLTELETYAICSENDEKQIVQTESQPSPVQSEALSDQLELADSKCSDVENNANIEKEKLTEAQNASYCYNKESDLERKTQSETLAVINVVLISDENKDTASDGNSDVVLVESSESVIPGTTTTPPVTAASPAENDPNVFVIGTQPGRDHDRKFYLDSSEESGAESGDGDEESDKEEEVDFIDEDENENDEDDILKTKSKLINSSSSIDTGLNLKELGGLYITFNAGKQGANSKAVKKIKDQNKDELLKNIILTPEFEKRYRVPALKVSERQMKKKRKEEESRTRSPVSQRKTRSSKPEANAKSPTESQSKDKESDKEKRVVQAESHPSTVQPATPPLKCSENVVIQLSQAEPEKKNLTELETYAICSENDEKQIVQTESQPSPVQSEALSDQLELADSKCSDVENNANIEKEKLTEAQNASYCYNKESDLERKTQSETLAVINVVLISDENKDTASDGNSDVVLVESSESVIPGTSTTPPVTAASPAENDPNVFVIDTQPGRDHDRKFYLDSSEESGAESGDGDEESDKEEEVDFIDEDENENDEDDILKTKSKLINSSSSIDTGLNLKELGGLYITFNAGKQGANSKAVKKIKDQNKDELLKNIILTPEFEKRYRVPALKVSERQMKKKRKEEESRTRSPVSQRKTRSSKPEANAKSPTESQSKDKESDKEKRVVQAESHPSTVQRATPPLKCSENVVIQLSQAEPEKKNLTELETYAICSENDEKQIVQTESQPSPVQSEALSDQLELADSKCSDVENNANIEKEKLTEAQNASYCYNKESDLERKTQSETLAVINVVLISDENKDTASDGNSDVVLVESSESVIPGTSTTPPVTAASPAENDPNVFVIDTQPGRDHDRKFYLDSSEESGAESGDGDEESDKEEEVDFIDEDENENDEDDILKTKSKLINSSSSIDTGLNLKELGGLYITFNAGKQGANSKAVKKIKDQNKDELLKNSILTPEFEKQYRVPTLKVSERQMKKKRKRECAKTAGDSWYNMKAPDLTDEVKNDLRVLKMRAAIDPKRFYKKNDREGFPKYFQVGKIIENPADFYHSRVPKKQRKQTMVEELLADAEFRRYNKRKYQQIMTEKAVLSAGKKNRKKKKFKK
ncbi:deoxynucleotidyltransferase terminal-interacting protein 2 isoform X2 [Rhinoraja longicauda]